MLRLNKVGGEEREAQFSFCLSLSLSLFTLNFTPMEGKVRGYS
jgi:hypothetical protein